MHTRQSGKALFPFIITLLLIFSVYLYLPSSHGEESDQKQMSTSVSAHTVSTQENAVMIEAIGSARANQAVYIKSAQNDYVTNIYFEDGDLVITHKAVDGQEEEIGMLKGLAVYTPNASKKLSIPLNIPDGTSLHGGALKVIYRSPSKGDIQVLAEASIPLS